MLSFEAEQLPTSELWHLFIEMTVPPDEFPSGDTVGFMNVIVAAGSAEAAQARVEAYFATFNWHIVQVESSKVVDSNFTAEDDEFAEMIESARSHPDPIILSTFHSYKIN
jgi:hypothetical protein